MAGPRQPGPAPSPPGESAGRSRWIYLAALLAIIPAGLGSRRFGSLLPEFIAAYAGDTLWSMMVMLIIILLRPPIATMSAAGLALAICYAIELTQFYHAPWIDAVRSNPLGGLALGYGFLWSDIACYTVGVLLAIPLDMVLRGLRPKPSR